jgi:hypothetical protein
MMKKFTTWKRTDNSERNKQMKGSSHGNLVLSRSKTPSPFSRSKISRSFAAALFIAHCSLLILNCEDPTRETHQPSIHFTAVTIEALTGQSINSVAYGNGVFIAGAGADYQGPDIAVSEDGVEWGEKITLSAELFDSYVGKIVYLNDSFLVTRGSGVKFGIFSVDNGQNWAKTDIGFGTKGLFYADGIYLAGGQHGQAAWSNDLTGGWNKLEVADTTFDQGIRSPGKTYSANSLYINAAAYGNGVFVLGGGHGHAAYSTDNALTWTSVTQTEIIFDEGFIDCMIFGAGKFIALGGMDGEPAKSAWSQDGIAWTQGGDPHLKAINGSPCIEYGGGYFLAADSDGNASFSADGLTWTAAADTTFAGTAIKGITYGNNKFIMVGGDGKAASATISD